MESIRLALVQMRCEKGAISQNLEFIAQTLVTTQDQAEIICFPEMSITGYINPNQHPEAVLQLKGPEVAQFVALTANTQQTVIAGIVEQNPEGKPFITQLVARKGRLVGSYRKRTIVDEEALLFSADTQTPLFWHGDLPFSLAICADIENSQVFTDGAQQGARVIFEAAAPGLYGAQETRNWQSGFEWWQGMCHTHLGNYAQANHVWIAVATQAGRTIDEDFPGGGYLIGPDGLCHAATPDWSEGVLYVSVPQV